MNETGKTTSTGAKRLAPELRARVDAYLLRVDDALTQHGATPFQRRGVATALRLRIMQQLAARGEQPTIGDVDAVLAELGRPDSHVGEAANYPRTPPVAGAPAAAAAVDSAPMVQPEADAAPPATRRTDDAARLSATAVLAALCAISVFAAIAILLFVTPENFGGTLIAAALCAAVATTVLGLIAIGQIQRSQGHLYGLSLALCCAMIFPLLLLDRLIFWICWQIADNLMQQQSINTPIYRLIREIIPTVAVILADYFLVVQAWTAVQARRGRR